MNQDNGGIIGKINTPTTNVASGVWSIQDQFESQSSSIWPLAFPQTTFTNSCRFDDGSSDYLSRTPSSETNTKTWTFSCWTKKSTNEEYQTLLSGNSSTSNNTGFFFNDTDELQFWNEISSSVNINIRTSAKFRDPSAWYHVVLALDTTQSTQSDRLKIYVNSVEQDLSISTNVSSDQVTWINDNVVQQVGGPWGQTGSSYFDGYMAEVILVDGQQLTPTSFGATNPVTNIWEPIAYAGTYGTNGFKLNFSDSSALGDDTSGNTNDFTANNLTSIDQSTDTPSNNFATLNSLTNNGTLSEGNLKVVTSTSLNDLTTASTIHVSEGKWYVEFKCVSSTSGTNYNIGITSDPSENIRASEYIGQSADSYGVLGSNGNFYNNASSVSYMNTFTAGDIIAIALDLDNNYIYFSKNGTWQNSGDPESGSSGTGGKAITAASSQSSGVYAFAVGDATGSGSMTFEINYGNPTFTISSGNSDAEGFGNFEYAVPSGYFALCTKNLAEYG